MVDMVNGNKPELAQEIHLAILTYVSLNTIPDSIQLPWFPFTLPRELKPFTGNYIVSTACCAVVQFKRVLYPLLSDSVLNYFIFQSEILTALQKGMQP